MSQGATKSIDIAAVGGTPVTAIPISNTPLTNIGAGEYETVAASGSQVLGGAGAIGDYLLSIVVVPATTSPGAVTIQDGNGSAITVFTGGASSVSNLVPFVITLGMTSTVGGWTLATGTNVSAIGIGNFT